MENAIEDFGCRQKTLNETIIYEDLILISTTFEYFGAALDQIKPFMELYRKSDLLIQCPDPFLQSYLIILFICNFN
uniref:Uncharacterized protein n=1 Tax=Romanomermis culicivorax TaxID=13658 RepID=A0A915HSY9_ROMCU